MEQNTYRLWKFIEFSDNWRMMDTSAIDDISPSWFERRKILKGSSQEYEEFILRLKREHAIETGIIERMYDLKKGITETFIKEGFVQSYISHGDTNIPVPKLLSHLRDHLDSVNFVFDVVNDNRPLTISFIKELHSLVTQHQEYAEGRDQLGNKLQIQLIKGKFKERENNPTREDGTVVLYCPPEHVDSEMDNLIRIYNELVIAKEHSIIIATWFHHAFTTIHPFQDGNGRIARLLASLILIKNGFFPFTVLREEAKVKYIEALESADNGNPQKLVDYFIEVQKRNIEKALNLKEVTSSSFDEVTDIFNQKIQGWRQKQHLGKIRRLAENRARVFDICETYLSESIILLQKKMNGNVKFTLESCSPNDTSRQHFYYGQIIKYAKKHDYFFNRAFPKSWIMFRVELSHEKIYQLGITIHHFGYDDSTLAIGAFLDFLSNEIEERIDATLPLEIKPHVISINNDITSIEKNIKGFLENALTLTLAQIASEI
jgi:fido (protein-threonine AMPylation protein)